MDKNEAKKRILARRARFVAIAVASAGLPAGTQACGGNVESNSAAVEEDAGLEACLSPPWEAGTDGAQPCLGAPLDASDEPQVCLQPPYDASDEPQVCLQPPLDAAPDDGAPEACLEPPWDAEPQPCLGAPPPDAGSD